jgi:hypothetical protein
VGIFQHKQPKKVVPVDPAAAAALDAFTEEFRQSLREEGKLYFERVINESAALFKQDLDSTIVQVNTDLKEHVVRQLDEQLVQYGQIMKDAQALALNSLNGSETELKQQRQELSDALKNDIQKEEEMLVNVVKDTQTLAVESLNRSGKALEEKYQQLASTLQQNVGVVEQDLITVFKENMAHITEVREAQDFALQSLTKNSQLLEQQYQQLGAALQQKVAEQENMLIATFQDNMAVIVEHYLLGALGDQFDLKAQLPAIIKQMEANKENIVGDMKL